MAIPARHLIPVPIAVVLAALVAGASGSSDEAENYKRLLAMPRERRISLAEDLDRFDRLDPKEQAAIRKLDAELVRKDPVDQARYRAVLRRYHLWANGLTDAQKKELEGATEPYERLAIARKFRLREVVEASAKGARISGIRTGDYGLVGPIEAAYLLKVWQKLSPQQQGAIAKRGGNRLRDEIKAAAGSTKVRREPFPAAEEKAYALRLEADPDFKSQLAPLTKRIEAAQKKGENAAKRAEANQRLFEHPFAEFLYFADHPSRPVTPRNFERFLGSCPAWLLEMLDPLSPDDARDYLTILYRQIYIHPEEMPEGSRAEPGGSASTPKGNPRKSPASPPPL